MVSTFTPNINWEEPARGDDVGTWDTPVNNNGTLIDLVVGANATISAAAGSVVLSAAQFRSRLITVNSTLLASITLTFPTSFTKDYKIRHVATGSSAFTITLATTASGGQAICCAPGETLDVFNDGANLFYTNLERVGSYWDYAGSSVPNWVSGCTVPPYLNCDGTVYSSATYPQLLALTGTTTLPDSRGQVRANLNQGTGRLVNGANGNILFSFGGTDTVTLTAAAIPSITSNGANNISVTTTVQVQNQNLGNSVQGISGGLPLASNISAVNATGSNNINVTSNNTGGGAHVNVQPTWVGGLTLIRAA